MKSVKIEFEKFSGAVLAKDDDSHNYYLDTQQGRILEIDNRWLNPNADLVTDQNYIQGAEAIIEILQDETGRFSEIPRLPAEIYAELIEHLLTEMESSEIGLKLLETFDKEDVLKEFEKILSTDKKFLEKWNNLLKKAVRLFAEDWLKSLKLSPQWI